MNDAGQLQHKIVFTKSCIRLCLAFSDCLDDFTGGEIPSLKSASVSTMIEEGKMCGEENKAENLFNGPLAEILGRMIPYMLRYYPYVRCCGSLLAHWVNSRWADWPAQASSNRKTGRDKSMKLLVASSV